MNLKFLTIHAHMSGSGGEIFGLLIGRVIRLLAVKLWITCLFLAAPLHGAGEAARLAFALGVLEESRGNDMMAAGHFDNALAADPLAAPLVRRKIGRLLAAGDRAAAVKLYRDLAAARTDEPEVQLAYADFLTTHGAGDAMADGLALETLEQLAEARPGEPEVVRRLFALYRSLGREADAVAALEALPAGNPDAAMLYASLSRSAHAADDVEARARVDERFREAMKSRPGNPTLARAASEHFRTTGRLEEAITTLTSHAAAAPSSLTLRTRLGILLFSAKRHEEGLAALNEVLEIDPRRELAHQALAKFHRRENDPAKARHHAGELLKLRGGSAPEFLALADEWLDSGEPRAARLLLEKAVFDHPDDAGLAMRLAIATRRDPGTREISARFFREAEALLEGDDATAPPAFLMESAEALIEQGQTSAAEDRLRRAIRSFPPEDKAGTAAALRRLAGLWQKEGRNAEAAGALLRRADSLVPEP